MYLESLPHPDDQPVFRSGFCAFLSLQLDMKVVGEAATKRMRTTYPDVNIVLCTTLFDTDGYVLEGVRARALRYFLKDAEDDEILEAIRTASERR